jgi:hypothetical protein
MPSNRRRCRQATTRQRRVYPEVEAREARPLFIKVGCLIRYRPEEVEAGLTALPTGGSSTNQRQVLLRTAK